MPNGISADGNCAASVNSAILSCPAETGLSEQGMLQHLPQPASTELPLYLEADFLFPLINGSLEGHLHGFTVEDAPFK
ncbi:hypothetical protein TcWFU_005032 [Taenia crassiceps]|uniref:Uncharacterized protein n=1 Tax=Taenia crassiceps TaxID=6207 RepID=A0ABR4QEH5_9CEST